MEDIVSQWKQGRSVLKRGQNAAELVPTWQVGTEQPPPHSYRSFAEDGYGKNSLIYSCIKEKATSIAALNPQVVRRDGTVAQRHRVAELLSDPNDYQDGQDFLELMMTQYEAAGNVYIHMIPLSDSPARRARYQTYPVQELELIRPDYVTIEPGRRREDDVFVVTVEGVVKRRVPRSQMIHVHEPNLLNDFYGMPKIALLIREGAIDLQMSDFELSFFRNAGVPMGMLQVKGRTSAAEIAEVKTRFRSAYNGIRKWFDLLVLNADEATYTPMGIPQNQMEMDTTRFHAESRICSVFGVPPIIVGARVSMNGNGIGSYEDAEHAFWAETMVPASLRFARAFQKFLLPKFATTRDEGAVVTFDFTQVRALQEDRSRKHREVVRMINTGAFTVNQALTLNGLPTIAEGDFYVRTGNQAEIRLLPNGEREIVQTAQPNAPNPDNPLEGAARLDESAAVREALTIFRRAD
jgi:HK97 family phage portal protein